jgi:chemotaxis signal transduction protein
LLFDHLRGDLEVFLAVIVAGASGDEASVERRADDEGDVLRPDCRKKLVDRRLGEAVRLALELRASSGMSKGDAALVPHPENPTDAMPTVETTRTSRRLLSVRVGRELLALPLERVERIQASVLLTPLPQPGTGFHAMTDGGDAAVPVLDLRRHVADAGSAPTPPCMLVQIEGALAGLAVDQVLRIEDIPDANVEDIAAHALLPISHVARSGDRLLSVLVIDRVLPPLDDVLALASTLYGPD